MQCSNEDINTIAGYGFDWRRVGRRLLDHKTVTDIDNDRGSEEEKREKVLQIWIKVKSNEATFQAIVKALRDTNDNSTADRVKELERKSISQAKTHQTSEATLRVAWEGPAAMVQQCHEQPPTGAIECETHGNGRKQSQIDHEQSEMPAFGKETLDELVRHEENSIDVKEREDEFVEQYCQEVKIILQAANENERVAIFRKLEPPVLKDGTKSDKILTFMTGFNGKSCHGEYSLGIFGGYQAAMVQTKQGKNCEPLIDATIEQFPNVSLILGVGVAYGASKDSTKLGDVLVADKIAELDTVKFRNDGLIVSRGLTGQVNDMLHTIFCRGSNKFNKKFACTEGTSPRYSKVHVGTIISGSFLVDNEKIKHKLWDNSIEAIGGEMEGHVLMDIIRKRDPCSIKAIIIKGVCDYGDGTKNKLWQITAALAAVEYAHFRLEQTKGTLFRDSGRKHKGSKVLPQKQKKPRTDEEATLGATLFTRTSLSLVPELKDLMSSVAAKIPAKWRVLGIQLDVPVADLDDIQLQVANRPDSSMDAFELMLGKWKSRSPLTYTWSTIIGALETPSVGANGVAAELRIRLTCTLV